MNRLPRHDSIITTVILLLYIIFFTSLFFSFRAISSLSIAGLLVTGAIRQRDGIKTVILRNPARLLLAGCAIFFLLQFISLLYTGNAQEGWKDIRVKTGLLITPLAIMLSGPFDRKSRSILLGGYYFTLLAACLYSLSVTTGHYFGSGNGSLFFYHQLVLPLHQHAVFFSIFVFAGLIFLLEDIQRKKMVAGNILPVILVLFFSFFLVLLSSKIVISSYILYLVFYFTSLLKKNTLNRKIIIGTAIILVISAGAVFFSDNPVSRRFRDIITGDPAIVQQDKFTPGDYFNGIQFRLLQWKLVPEILSRQQSWWTGVGADAQNFLNQQYALKNMYLGDPATGNKGYRAYNTHNQFLESLLTNGIPGLLAFIFIFSTLIRMAWQRKQRETTFIIALLLAYAGIESVFETQYGIILFTFFPSFLCQPD